MTAATDGPPRLRPEMASLRLLVLDFVRQYFARWGHSPSYGEIAHGLGCDRDRVRQAVKRMVKAGQLLRRPGPRGLALPVQQEDAAALLRGLGWRVEEEASSANRPLPDRFLLDYLPPGEGDTRGKTGRGAARKRG